MLPPKSPALSTVLDFVRSTGKSAHPQKGEKVSDLVMMVALMMDQNPIALQAEVEAYADALDNA